MKNLAPVAADKNRYRYRDRPQGEVVEVEVQYRKGSSPRMRGIYISVHPAEIAGEIRVLPLFGGHQALVCSLERTAPSVLRRIAEVADEHVPRLAEAFRKDPDGEGRAALQALAADLPRLAATTPSGTRSPAGAGGV